MIYHIELSEGENIFICLPQSAIFTKSIFPYPRAAGKFSRKNTRAASSFNRFDFCRNIFKETFLVFGGNYLGSVILFTTRLQISKLTWYQRKFLSEFLLKFGRVKNKTEFNKIPRECREKIRPNEPITRKNFALSGFTNESFFSVWCFRYWKLWVSGSVTWHTQEIPKIFTRLNWQVDRAFFKKWIVLINSERKFILFAGSKENDSILTFSFSYF